MEREFLLAYDRLAAGVEKTAGFDGALVKKVSVDAIRDELKDRGFLPLDDKKNILQAGRSLFFKVKAHWINVAAEKLTESDGLIWRK